MYEVLTKQVPGIEFVNANSKILLSNLIFGLRMYVNRKTMAVRNLSPSGDQLS